MASERFLINPPKRRRVKKSVRKISRKLKLNSWPAHRAEHKVASIKGWKRRKHRAAGYAAPRGASFPRVAARKSSHRRSSTTAERHYLKGNPFGEEVILMGANPKRRKRHSTKRRKRSYARAVNPPKRHKRRRTRINAANPRKRVRARRRHRRNPAAIAASGINFMRPMTLIAPALAGIAALYAGNKIPAMLNMTTGLPKYGVKLATAIGGQMIIKKAFRRNDLANVFAIVSLVQIGYEALNEYVLAGMGLGMLPYGYGHTSALGYGAFPEELAVSGYGAVPQEVAQQY